MAIWYKLSHFNGNQLLLVHASEFTPNTYFMVINSGTRLSSLALPAPERTWVKLLSKCRGLGDRSWDTTGLEINRTKSVSRFNSYDFCGQLLP